MRDRVPVPSGPGAQPVAAHHQGVRPGDRRVVQLRPRQRDRVRTERRAAARRHRAGAVAPGGLVSLLVRNGDALAMRPGLLGDWETANAAFGETGYHNRLGVDARADRLQELSAELARRGLEVTQWSGVRIFTDIVADAQVPDEATLDAILNAEERAGRTDPYRHVAALLHVVASRGTR